MKNTWSVTEKSSGCDFIVFSALIDMEMKAKRALGQFIARCHTFTVPPFPPSHPPSLPTSSLPRAKIIHNLGKQKYQLLQTENYVDNVSAVKVAAICPLTIVWDRLSCRQTISRALPQLEKSAGID